MNATKRKGGLRRIFGLLVVILLLVVGMSLLMPSLQSARMVRQKAAYSRGYDSFMTGVSGAEEQPPEPTTAQRPVVRGEVRTFRADVDLTSRVSIGTADPESIYEARFHADIEARNPAAAAGDAEIRLPLPPQLISLSDLLVTVNDDPDEDVFVDDANLIWRGRLDAEIPSQIEISYVAVGKGLFELRVPPGKIVDLFDVTLTANSSDLRMMELSLQPEPPKRQAGQTIYHWHYERLMLGRPIRIDILGMTPTDRLAELVWLGPVSVLVFGLLVSMIALAYRPEMLDKWMLLLIVGAFAAAYPLMYYAQDFVPLMAAIIAACVAMMIIVGVRAVTLLGARVGVLGVVLSGSAVLAVVMVATLCPYLRGFLLTVLVVGALVTMMALLPRAQKSSAALSASPEPPPQPEQTQ